eukprot:5003005-Pleurochrysis_carterae.AAC.2
MLTSLDITADSSSVSLTQEKYIAHLVSTYLPDGVPLAFHKTRAPASETLPKLIEQALLTKPSRSHRRQTPGIVPVPCGRASVLFNANTP